MDKLNYYRVEIVVKAGLVYDKVGHKFESKEVSILAENKYRYCLTDDSFTTIEKKKSDYSTSLDDPSISSSVNDSCWGTSIRYTLYSGKVVMKSTIKLQIAKYITEKYGAFSSIDLSFLDAK